MQQNLMDLLVVLTSVQFERRIHNELLPQNATVNMFK